ncbi:MAG: dodecin family protein [Magnetospirillum sp.]|nr:dodecin family protein [Magnetospirillum sp.]
MNTDKHVYKIIHLAGSSPDGMEAAIGTAIGKAAKTLRNLRWFEVTQTRGHIEDGRIAHWQVILRVGFTLEEDGQ